LEGKSTEIHDDAITRQRQKPIPFLPYRKEWDYNTVYRLHSLCNNSGTHQFNVISIQGKTEWLVFHATT